MGRLAVLVFDKNKPTRFISVAFNKALTGDGYKQYNYDSPWIAPVRLIKKQDEAFKQAAYESAAFGIGGQGVYRSSMEEARKVTGYRFELDENVPDYMWYQKTFPDNYSTGEVPTRTPDANAEGNVPMPN